MNRSKTAQALNSLFLIALAIGRSSTATADIIDGTASKDGEYSAVFAITQPSDTLGTLCTATLISPRVLLTAAHCLPAPDKASSSPIWVTNTTDIRGAKALAISTLSYRHPRFNSSADELTKTAYDVGLVILPADATGITPATLTSIEADSVREAAFTLDSLLVVGYGGTKTFYEDTTTGQQAWAKTHAVESTKQILTVDGPKSALSRGDTGGPLFLIGANGDLKLIGVASAPGSVGRSGVPQTSLYAGIRQEILNWISTKEPGP